MLGGFGSCKPGLGGTLSDQVPVGYFRYRSGVGRSLVNPGWINRAPRYHLDQVVDQTVRLLFRLDEYKPDMGDVTIGECQFNDPPDVFLELGAQSFYGCHIYTPQSGALVDRCGYPRSALSGADIRTRPSES